MNIAVAETGYERMSNATLLALHNHVVAVDVIPEKLEKIENCISPILDGYIEMFSREIDHIGFEVDCRETLYKKSLLKRGRLLSGSLIKKIRFNKPDNPALI
jgi:UDP-glucose 6-dehydrogenase